MIELEYRSYILQNLLTKYNISNNNSNDHNNNKNNDVGWCASCNNNNDNNNNDNNIKTAQRNFLNEPSSIK